MKNSWWRNSNAKVNSKSSSSLMFFISSLCWCSIDSSIAYSSSSSLCCWITGGSNRITGPSNRITGGSNWIIGGSNRITTPSNRITGLLPPVIGLLAPVIGLLAPVIGLLDPVIDYHPVITSFITFLSQKTKKNRQFVIYKRKNNKNYVI